MEAVIWMALGAGGMISLYLIARGIKTGWASWQATLKQRAALIEADFSHHVQAAVGDIDARIRDIVHSELAKFESDIASIKAKVGGLT